jgi:hypothetical protein
VSSPEEVCQYLRVLGHPPLDDTYLSQHMSMYYDAQGRPEQQSSLPMAYNESNTNYGQFEDLDKDKMLSADGHY